MQFETEGELGGRDGWMDSNMVVLGAHRILIPLTHFIHVYDHIKSYYNSFYSKAPSSCIIIKLYLNEYVSLGTMKEEMFDGICSLYIILACLIISIHIYYVYYLSIVILS